MEMFAHRRLLKLDALRATFEAIRESNPLGLYRLGRRNSPGTFAQPQVDGSVGWKIWGLQVTDATYQSMQLRALMGA